MVAAVEGEHGNSNQGRRLPTWAQEGDGRLCAGGGTLDFPVVKSKLMSVSEARMSQHVLD